MGVTHWEKDKFYLAEKSKNKSWQSLMILKSTKIVFSDVVNNCDCGDNLYVCPKPDDVDEPSRR